MKEIEHWFAELWKVSRPIKPEDLAEAQIAYDAARAVDVLRGEVPDSESLGAFVTPTVPAFTPRAAEEINPSPVGSPVPEFIPIIGMPIKEKNGQRKPLYSPGSAIADLFMLFTGSGSRKSEIVARMKHKSTEIKLLRKHCDEEGREKLRWDIAVNGELTPFFPDWFDAVGASSRIQFVNLRESDSTVNNENPRGQSYRS